MFLEDQAKACRHSRMEGVKRSRFGERRFVRPVYGAAFRAAVKPNVVGDVEVGYGKEGAAVFVDIGYPF